jgi:2-haloacid dehalogenase
MASSAHIETVVFDLGGVLIDWNPRYLYRKIFTREDDVDHFLAEICTRDWHEQQDAGQSTAQATRDLTARHPTYRAEIEAFYGRFDEMLGGPLADSVSVLQDLKRQGTPLFALSNWPAETFPAAQSPYEFLEWFDGIVVSGREGVKKPDRRLFDILYTRHTVVPTATLFIDDVAHNVTAAQALGFHTHHFRDAAGLRAELEGHDLLPGA